jgi:hypothetical protein
VRGILPVDASARRRPVALPAALLADCAGLACAPAAVAVADKDTRAELRREPRGIRSEADDARGRAGFVHRQVIATEYCVRDREGQWCRVPESAWRAAEPGQPIQVCR